ncbi:hypothetical protein EGW08_006329, partial [Elysia chlorotica]
LNETGTFNISLCFKLQSSSTCSPPTVSDLQRFQAMCSASKTQSYVVFSAALVLGLPGSILALILLGRMPTKPSTLYLRLLAVSDFVALVSLSVTYYEITGYHHVTNLDNLLKWFSRIFQSFSHWLLVLMCVERFVAVRYPLHKARLYTIRITYVTCFAVFLVSSIHFLLFPMTFVIKSLANGNYFFYVTLMYFSIYIFLPMILIVLFTNLTALEIRRSRRRRQSLVMTVSNSLAFKMEAEITRIMFLAVLSFVLFLLPKLLLYIFYIVDLYLLHIEKCPEYMAAFTVSYNTFTSLSYLNHAVNFYIYMLGAPGYRRQ